MQAYITLAILDQFTTKTGNYKGLTSVLCIFTKFYFYISGRYLLPREGNHGLVFAKRILNAKGCTHLIHMRKM